MERRKGDPKPLLTDQYVQAKIHLYTGPFSPTPETTQVMTQTIGQVFFAQNFLTLLGFTHEVDTAFPQEIPFTETVNTAYTKRQQEAGSLPEREMIAPLKLSIVEMLTRARLREERYRDELAKACEKTIRDFQSEGIEDRPVTRFNSF